MKYFLFLFFSLFFSACSVKEYKLFQPENQEHLSTPDKLNIRSAPQELNITYSSKIQPNDILVIDIYNMNKKSNIMISDRGAAVIPDNKYVVYSDGTIILPLLNVVNVEGLTIKELNQQLKEKYRAFLKAPYVKSSIKNHKVYVLGEVTKRGVVNLEGETISVIEAIAKSGGLTDYAIRDRIRVISEKNGKYVMNTLNLNKFSTLNSSNLMLTNNSIVYIEPKGSKAIKVAIDDYLPILRAISSVLGTFLTIDYLNK